VAPTPYLMKLCNHFGIGLSPWYLW